MIKILCMIALSLTCKSCICTTKVYLVSMANITCDSSFIVSVVTHQLGKGRYSLFVKLQPSSFGFACKIDVISDAMIVVTFLMQI